MIRVFCLFMLMIFPAMAEEVPDICQPADIIYDYVSEDKLHDFSGAKFEAWLEATVNQYGNPPNAPDGIMPYRGIVFQRIIGHRNVVQVYLVVRLNDEDYICDSMTHIGTSAHRFMNFFRGVDA